MRLIMDCLVKKVKPAGELKLLVEFKNGTTKQYDVEPVLKRHEVFKKLVNNDKLFNRVHVCYGGWGISWNKDIDLACEELWQNGIPV